MPTYSYLRQSLDPTGAALAVTRQREALQRMGFQISEEFCDNDLSASSGRPRPRFERLLKIIAPGDTLLVWRLDRLARRPVDLERLITLAEGGITIHTETGDVRLDTPDGRLHARLLVSVAAHEVEVKSARQRLSNRQAELLGIPRWSTRPFGLMRVGDSVVQVPEEVAIVHELVRRVLQGESLSSLARELNASGQFNSVGKPWNLTTLRNTLTRPGLIGHLADRKGTVLKADVWEPILDAETFVRIKLLFADPTRRTHRGTTPSKLLSGIAECGRCLDDGKKVYVGSFGSTSFYLCPRCRIKRSSTRIDEWVSLQLPKIAAVMRPAEVDLPEHVRKELDVIAGRRRGLASLLADGSLSEADVRDSLDRLDRARDTLLSSATKVASPDPRAAFAQALDAWPTLTLARQRMLVSDLARVVIRPAGGRGIRGSLGHAVAVIPLGINVRPNWLLGDLVEATRKTS